MASGRYVSGLSAQLQVQAPDGTQRTVSLPETTGVTAYYETVMVFEQIGEHRLTLRTTMAKAPLSGTFDKVVGRSALTGDWTILTGNAVVLVAFIVTWIGLVLSVQRRFMPPTQPRSG